jgi:hypothetical protein
MTRAGWLVLGGVAVVGLVWWSRARSSVGARTTFDERAQALATGVLPTRTAPTQQTALTGSSRSASGPTPTTVLGAIYQYGKQVLDVVRGGAAVVETGVLAPEAGSVTGDVLGTGALTTTAPDVLLPVAEVTPAVTIVGAEAGAETAGAAAAATGAEVGATVGVEVGAGAALGIAGGFLAIGFLVQEIVNLGLNEYQQGDISKAIMAAKQEAIRSYGNQALQGAVQSAPSFTAAMQILASVPGQGQIQIGVGAEYAGVNTAPGATTPRWPLITATIGAPATLRDHPDLIGQFLANLWVQTGASGSAAFDADNTLRYRMILLAHLPYTPAWNGVRQLLLNAKPVDPRDPVARDAAYAAVPTLPQDLFLRVGNAKLDTRGVYSWYNVYRVPPASEPSTVEAVAVELAGRYPSERGFQNLTLSAVNGVGMGIRYTAQGWDSSGLPTTSDSYGIDPRYLDLTQACARGVPTLADLMTIDPIDYAGLVNGGDGGAGAP